LRYLSPSRHAHFCSSIPAQLWTIFRVHIVPQRSTKKAIDQGDDRIAAMSCLPHWQQNRCCSITNGERHSTTIPLNNLHKRPEKTRTGHRECISNCNNSFYQSPARSLLFEWDWQSA